METTSTLDSPHAPSTDATVSARAGRWSLAAIWTLAVALTLIGLSNAILAFIYPMELELREGTGWLHVLAINSGINIYDHSRVAFVNMNHGPLDPILKAALARCFPSLSPAMVTRFPVLLLPLAMFALALALVWKKSSRPWLDALLWSMGLYVAVLGIHPYLLLVGRSDPMTLTLLLIGLIFIHLSGQTAGWKLYATAAATGLMLTASCLSCWRTATVAIVALVANFTLLRYRRALSWTSILAYFTTAAVTGAALFLLILARYFHWDWDLYQEHFFGFFFSSGWKIERAGFLQLLSALLVLRGMLALAIAAIVVAWIYRCRRTLHTERTEETFLTAALAFCFFITVYSIQRNITGGGVWYFAGFFCMVWFWGLTRLRNPADFNWARWIGVVVLLFVANWQLPVEQILKMSQSLPNAQAYMAKLREIDQANGLASEEFFFYKTKYSGQTIDMGDTVYAILQAANWDARFNATAQAYFDHVTTDPPRYFIAANSNWAASSGPVREILAKYYRPQETCAHLFAFPEGRQDSVVCVR